MCKTKHTYIINDNTSHFISEYHGSSFMEKKWFNYVLKKESRSIKLKNKIYKEKHPKVARIIQLIPEFLFPKFVTS